MMPMAVERSFGRDPLRDDAHRGREGSAFAHAQQKARGEQQSKAGGEAVQGACERPPQHDDEEAAPRSEAVQQTASADVQRGIGEQERGLQIGELLVGDGDVALDRGDRDGQRLAVEVADRDGHRHQRDGVPAQSLHAGCVCRDVLVCVTLIASPDYQFRCSSEMPCAGISVVDLDLAIGDVEPLWRGEQLEAGLRLAAAAYCSRRGMLRRTHGFPDGVCVAVRVVDAVVLQQDAMHAGWNAADGDGGRVTDLQAASTS